MFGKKLTEFDRATARVDKALSTFSAAVDELEAAAVHHKQIADDAQATANDHLLLAAMASNASAKATKQAARIAELLA